MTGPRAVAALSPGLLARKGQATPAMRRPDPNAPEGEVPPVLALRAELTERVAGRRAAFTLRLDADRHRALHRAATARGVSAQRLLIDALDAFIAATPDDGQPNELQGR